jgi:hypothetical protein
VECAVADSCHFGDLLDGVVHAPIINLNVTLMSRGYFRFLLVVP